MEHLAAEYSGPVTVTLCGFQVDAHAELQAWAGEPSGADESGAIVHALDPPTPPRWQGTITVDPGDGAPIELPADGQLTLRLGGRHAAAEVEVFEWTAGETLVVAVLGQGPAPFPSPLSMTNCTTCRQEYDETDDEAVTYHTKPVHCSQTNRCRRCYGSPSCYFCQSSFCFCTSH